MVLQLAYSVRFIWNFHWAAKNVFLEIVNVTPWYDYSITRLFRIISPDLSKHCRQSTVTGRHLCRVVN
jgi:hypothetical protein